MTGVQAQANANSEGRTPTTEPPDAPTVTFEECSQAIQSANVSDEEVIALIDKRLGALDGNRR